MNEKQKQRIRSALKKGFTFFTVYALLPLFCGVFAALFFYLNSVGIEEAEAAFVELGDQSLFAVAGGRSEAVQTQTGLYFLSPELSPPTAGKDRLMIGCATYFSPSSILLVPSDQNPQKEEVPKEQENAPAVIYDSLPAGATPIISADLSSSSYVINNTKYTVDPEEVRNSPFPSGVSPVGEEPLVLVLHTHGTECYFEDDTNLSDFAPEGVESYFLSDKTSFRTTDASKSVVQVGKVFSDTLNELGIPTLHCTVMHDKEDFNSAYGKSAETVKRMLAQYPSIQYVIDLHRDSIERSGSYVKSSTVLEGKESAQVMLVVGTNQNGSHPNWRQNLIVATAFRDSMDTHFPSLSCSLYLRGAGFNQSPLPGCMLLEVGSAANSLKEAENAAFFAAKAFYEMLRSRQ